MDTTIVPLQPDYEVGVPQYVCLNCFRRCEDGVLWSQELGEFRSHLCCDAPVAIACLWPRQPK